ncbi:MAG: DUF4838 domain-containing protein [bacterium]|nr:DUF4838 domain-containing protein [bacterium]
MTKRVDSRDDRETVTIVGEGSSGYRIVVEESASHSDRYAAEVLRDHLKACSGVDIPISRVDSHGSGPMLVVGSGAVARGLGVSPSGDSLGEWGCAIRTVGPHVVIAGTPHGGTLFGVRDFLRQELGVRRYAPGVTRIPSTPSVAVPRIDRTVAPAFAWRHIDRSSWPGCDEEFANCRGLNAWDDSARPEFGLQHQHDGLCHTFLEFVDPAEHFEGHPEYFSLVGGKRLRHGTQLCLSSPDVFAMVKEKMIARMADRPDCRQHSFSQMDYGNFCECSACRAANGRSGVKGGALIEFVNRLAEATSREYPEKLVSTLAYMDSQAPPAGMRMHPNVAVWLCDMYPCCCSHSILSCEQNAVYRRHAEGWARACDHLYVWHYVSNFAHYYCPFPNLRALAEDIRFYRDIGVEGIYAQALGRDVGDLSEEGAYASTAGSEAGGGDSRLVRAYLVTELMRDPDQDAASVVRDFLSGYYGPAANAVERYLSLIHDKVDTDDIHMHPYTNPAQGYLPDEVVDVGGRLFDEAEAEVHGDATLLERVRVARMPLVYARLFPRNGYRFSEDHLVFNGPLAEPEEATGFVERMARHGFKTIREWGGEPDQLPLYAAVLNDPVPVATLQNGLLTVDVVPILGGRVMRIVHNETGTCVTAHNVKQNLIFPFGGGEGTYIGGAAAGQAMVAGAMDPAVETVRGDLSVQIEQYAGGFTVVREIGLHPTEPTVTVTAKVTNPGERAVPVQVRSHFELAMVDSESTRVRFKNRAGRQRDLTMSGVVAGLRDGTRFLESECPDGEWTFTGWPGLEVTQRFDDGAMDFAWLYAFPAELRDLEVDLWLHPRALEPGEQMAFTHELSVRERSTRGRKV